MVKIIPENKRTFFFFIFWIYFAKLQNFTTQNETLYKEGFGAGSGFSLRLVPSSNLVFGWFLVPILKFFVHNLNLVLQIPANQNQPISVSCFFLLKNASKAYFLKGWHFPELRQRSIIMGDIELLNMT
jgi:hypothetical protein